MFRSGGPIKEGIMDGMKEPQAINTVGSPLAPQDASGRQKYAFQLLPFLGLAGGTAARTAAPTVVRSAPGFFSKIKNIFQTQTPAPFSPVKIGQSKGGKLLNLKPIVKKGGPGPDPKDVAQISELRPYFANDPTIALIRGTYNALTDPKAQTLFSKSARFVLSPTGIITAGYFAQGKFFDGEGNEIPDDKVKELGLTAGNKVDEKVITGESDQGGRTLTRDEEIEANRKRYYKLMGIDKLNKQAAYNTLIDASNQIREGGNIKDQIKSGSLASSVINALSKNLDSSVDLKKQIDAAILKGEITKDINREKDQLDATYKKLAIDKLQNEAAGGTIKQIINTRKEKGLSTSGRDLFQLAVQSGIGDNIKQILPEKQVSNFLKDNPTKTTLDFFKQVDLDLQEQQGEGLTPGDYVVGETILRVSEDGKISFVI